MESDITQTVTFYRVWGWFETYKKEVLGAAAVVAALGLIIGLLVWRHDQHQLEASQALSKVYMSQVTTPGQPVPVAQYLEVAANFSGTDAAARAVILAAGSLYAQGKFDDARAQFQRLVRDYPASPYAGAAQLGNAACLQAQGKSAEALTAYKQIVDTHRSEWFTPEASFALARLYEQQNKPELAYSTYLEVERTAPYSQIGNEAGMRVEELQAKLPALAPKGASAPVNLKK